MIGGSADAFETTCLLNIPKNTHFSVAHFPVTKIDGPMGLQQEATLKDGWDN